MKKTKRRINYSTGGPQENPTLFDLLLQNGGVTSPSAGSVAAKTGAAQQTGPNKFDKIGNAISGASSLASLAGPIGMGVAAITPLLMPSIMNGVESLANMGKEPKVISASPGNYAVGGPVDPPKFLGRQLTNDPANWSGPNNARGAFGLKDSDRFTPEQIEKGMSRTPATADTPYMWVGEQIYYNPYDKSMVSRQEDGSYRDIEMGRQYTQSNNNFVTRSGAKKLDPKHEGDILESRRFERSTAMNPDMPYKIKGDNKGKVRVYNEATKKEMFLDTNAHLSKYPAPKQGGYMPTTSFASGGDITLSSNTFQVKGNPNKIDGNSYVSGGEPINLDHNEVVTDNFVFSNRLKDPQTKQKYSEMAKKIQSSTGKAERILSSNPQDLAAKNTIKYNAEALQQLATSQETYATALGLRENRPNGMVWGGPNEGQGTPPTQAQQDQFGLRYGNRQVGVNPYYQGPLTEQGYPYVQMGGNSRFLQNPSTGETYVSPGGTATPRKSNFPQQIPDGTYTPEQLSQFRQNWVNLDPNYNFLPGGSNAQPMQAQTAQAEAVLPFPDPTAALAAVTAPGQPVIGGGFGPTAATPKPAATTGAGKPAAKKAAVKPAASTAGATADPYVFDQSNYKKPVYAPWEVPLYGIPNTRQQNIQAPLQMPAAGVASQGPGFAERGLEQYQDASTIPGSTTSNVSSKGRNRIPFTAGDALQAGTVAGKFLQLLGGPETEAPNLDNTKITQKWFDQAPALYNSQSAYTNAMNRFGNANAAQRSGMANQMLASRLNADNQTMTQYGQQNMGELNNYEQALANQRRFNVGQLNLTNDLNARNRGAWKNAADVAMDSLGNFGQSLNQKRQGQDVLNLMSTQYADVYERIFNAYMSKKLTEDQKPKQ